MIEKVLVWLRNAKSFQHRLMANYLRKRGWVVFYLEEQSRHCDSNCCWLKLYQEGEKDKALLNAKITSEDIKHYRDIDI